MPKIERKYLAHFLDAKFGVKTQGEEPTPRIIPVSARTLRSITRS